MNADLLRIRNSKLFRKLPDRAFERIASYIKVRAFENGDEVLNFQESTEFSQSFGYVISGQILFLDEMSKPLGLAIKDEFFLGRGFTLNEKPVVRLVSANEKTFVVFVPRDVVTLLAKASEHFSDMIEEIYDSIFERAKMVQSDLKAQQKVQDWLKQPDADKTLSLWVSTIEKRRGDSSARREFERQTRQKVLIVWAIGISTCLLFFIECMVRLFHIDFSFFYFIDPNWKTDAYKPGSAFNIFIGIIGYTLILLTMLHTFLRWTIKKWKWRVNYQFSQELHMFFGFLGFLFVLLHSSFQFKGWNVADVAAYGLMIAVGSGLVGEFISAQIPKTIRGEMVKLEQLKEEQGRLREKASLLMNDQAMYKTSVLILAESERQSAAASFLLSPFAWAKAWRLQGTLKRLGLGAESAKLASGYLIQEFKLRQKVKFLEISNIFFKRWMMIHKPIGWIVYVLATVHVLLVTLLG